MTEPIDTKNNVTTVTHTPSVELLELIDLYTQKLENTTTAALLETFIQIDFLKLTTNYIKIGDTLFNQFTEKGKGDENELICIHYNFPEAFKDIAILHRDIALQLQIARHKLQEHKITEDKVSAHFQASKKVLQDAIETLKVKLKPIRKSSFNKINNSVSNIIKHQKNPWGIYKAQFQKIIVQCKDIAKANGQIERTIKTFKGISEYHQTLSNEAETFGNHLKLEISKLLGALKDVQSVTELSAVLTKIETLLLKVEKPVQHQELYTDEIAAKIKLLREVNTPVSNNAGLLLTNKIDFNKNARKWIEYEILPFYLDVWDNILNMESYFKHSLMNLKNSLSLIKGEKDLERTGTQLQVLKEVHQGITNTSDVNVKTLNGIKNKLQNDFKVTNIYGNGAFLEVSLQSSFTQFTSGQRSIAQGINTQLKKMFATVTSKYNKAKMEGPTMAIERATDCIQHRMFKEENAQYDMLFLNKNFIGDLFIAERTAQEDKIKGIVKQWKDGFSKSVLLTGNRLSGKTTLLEQVEKQNLDRATIHLQVESDITIEGRKFATTRNLEAALAEVKKAVYNTNPILCIDDLETWQNDETILLDSVRALVRFIESESESILVFVSTTSAMQNHLDQRLRFSHIFSTNIDVNKSKIEEIFKALIVRHGASHKKLVNLDGQPISAKEIESKIQHLSKKYDNNIGEVLQAWTFNTATINAENVSYHPRDLRFYDFFTDEEVILLKQVILNRYTNEVILKRFLGQQINGAFQSGLKRLIRTKVLLRNENSLYLNPVLYFDVHMILKYRGTLK